MPDLIRHPVFIFLDSGQRKTLVRVRRNDNTTASRGEWTRKKIQRDYEKLKKAFEMVMPVLVEKMEIPDFGRKL